MTVDTDPEVNIGAWAYDRTIGRYSNINGLYIQARKQELGWLIKLEFKWADRAPDGSSTAYAAITLREYCQSEEEFDATATKIYKKLHAMLLALEPFKDTE